jgi:hypothetical protein
MANIQTIHLLTDNVALSYVCGNAKTVKSLSFRLRGHPSGGHTPLVLNIAIWSRHQSLLLS